MQGLLDIWNNYWDRPEPSGSSTSFDDEWRKKKLMRGQTERNNLSTAGGVPTGDIVPRQHVGRGQTVNQGTPSHKDPNYVPRNRLGKEYPEATAADIAAGKTVQLASGKHIVSPGKQAQVLATKSQNKVPTLANQNTTAFHPSQGDLKYHGGNEGEQLKWWEVLANKVGFDPEKAKATWKAKGGFEGLMANPAFTMGLAFMSAGAEGKSMSESALDSVMKAGGISQHYKKILKDRKKEPIQATATDIAEVEDILKTINIEPGNWLENIVAKAKGGNPGAEWSAAVEEIAVQFQADIEKWQNDPKNQDANGNPKIIRIEDKIKIMNKLIKSGKIKKKESWFGQFTADTLSKPIPMAEGGPIQAGQPYLVGEEGPEVIIPSSDGDVLSNDDSQIYAMLLASNPQLQKVSRARAEKILRARFPEYFE